MVKIEHKRAYFLVHFGKYKFEYTIEPRYWRNPLIGIGLIALLPLFLRDSPDLLTLFTTANIYACIAIPLAWQMTGIGRMNFGPQFFLALGGFSAALTSIHFGWVPWQTFFIAVLVGLVFGAILSGLTTIAKGLYFSLITLILPLIFLEITYVFTDIFKGETGLCGIAKLIDLGQIKINYLVSSYFSVILLIVFLFIVDKVLRSRIGLFSAAINDEEDVARGLGLSINKWKIVTFIVTSTMVAITGWFTAHYFGTFAGVTYLPLSFMLKILIIVIVGGRGEIYGSIIGAYFVAILEKVLTFFGPIHYVLFPVIMLILLFSLPEGLYGLYRKHKYREYYPTMKLRNR